MGLNIRIYLGRSFLFPGTDTLIQTCFFSQLFKITKRHPPHNPEILRELKSISDEWLSLPGRREMTFSLGYFPEKYLQSVRIVALRKRDGTLSAFANNMPVYWSRRVAVDLMRYRKTIPNGAMDYLFIRFLELLCTEGFEVFNFGLAPLSGVSEQESKNIEEQAIVLLYKRANNIFTLQGLCRYKDKFRPDWEQNFMVYQGGVIGFLRASYALIHLSHRTFLD